MSLNGSLRQHWKINGVVPCGGTTAAEIAAFENQHDVSLPADLQEYLLEFNGTLDMSATDWFRFLRLQDFASSNMQTEMSFGEALQGAYPSIPNGFFVFCRLSAVVLRVRHPVRTSERTE